ncbi:MCE family protein [Nocardioides alcanivorans]|uniref:MCE family protein n=1 Tax=Nocardioides alcanivorans TaxID=2897352 RepID=UPI001F3E0067|nr:MlaD family protein [Nocardioides alcanivorans]
MRGHTDRQVMRYGAISLVVALLVIAATFNLQKFPGLAGADYKAQFQDASGLRKGNMVQVAGMRVGKVNDMSVEDGLVVVDFEVDGDVEFGTESRAEVKVLNLLGEKYLELVPAGPGQMKENATIPVERTNSAYDIVNVLGDLSDTTERIETDRLSQALSTIGDVVEVSGPELEGALDGITRLSETVSSRDAELKTLLASSKDLTQLLDERKVDLMEIMQAGQAVFRELSNRKESVHRLLVSAKTMAKELKGVAEDNQAEIGPAMKELDQVLTLLNNKDKQLRRTLRAYGPYADILGDVIGTGPWFDAYVVNLLNIANGEFSDLRTS